MPHKRRLLALSASLALLSAGAVAVVRLMPPRPVRATPSVPAPATGMRGSIVDQLVYGNHGSSRVRSSDHKTVVLEWNAPNKNITVHRSERQNSSGPWAHQAQEISASYAIVDASSRCDQSIYVAGIWPNGDSIVEEWALIHPPTFTQGGTYIPIDQRERPAVRRGVLYAGTSMGVIRSMEPDPKGRFLLMLTHGDHTLLRMDLTHPAHPITAVHTTSSLPQLAEIQTILFAKHGTEGNKFVLTKEERSKHLHKDPQDTNPYVIFLSDGNDDGVLDTPQVLDAAAWNAGNYGSTVVWTLYGPSCN